MKSDWGRWCVCMSVCTLIAAGLLVAAAAAAAVVVAASADSSAAAMGCSTAGSCQNSRHLVQLSRNNSINNKRSSSSGGGGGRDEADSSGYHDNNEDDDNNSDLLDWDRDVFIGVKTSQRFHTERVLPILDTWFSRAAKQTWFFTDADDPELSRKTDGHVINTKCPPTHHRKALCCKMAAEFDAFMTSTKKWFCHFDDDNYVNTEQLQQLLAGYSWRQLWYLGKNSIKNPIEIVDYKKRSGRVSFWFGTGGAGFCISRALALKMAPLAGGGRFMSIGDRIRLPDDVTMGYIIEHLLSTRLTVVDKFHSHLEQMRFVRPEVINQQVSFSYSGSSSDRNTVNVTQFPADQDPTRFYSLHCLLFPDTDYCHRQRLPSRTA